ncbi:hypothetical protein MNBD_PLANCTO02-3331 [hydrothermal vent metagenome]|uniref:NfeD-like C-terminal domain-containing protein n=1 Tax=hydrothermal vent metagenome TaxID=652676 RepID=A0A3B1DSE6_9ZZZZ
METLFTYCAIIGGILFVGQLVLVFIGIGGDHCDIDTPDADVDFDGSEHLDISGEGDGWFVGILSLRSIVAAMTVFGLAGKGALLKGFSEQQTILIAFVAGAAVLYLVGWVFKELYKIRSDGTVKIQSTIGCRGKVYLTIPAGKKSAGKVTISVAERTMEYLAMTNGEELTKGMPVVVVSVLAPDMVEVEGANNQTERFISSSSIEQ